MSYPKTHHLVLAGAVIDAAGHCFQPGALRLATGGEVLVVGPAEDLKRKFKDDERIDCTQLLVLPALVNAHAHLDLTEVGPRSYEGDFMNWIRMVRSARSISGNQDNVGAVEQSVRKGIELSLAGGTGIIGDIAGMGSSAPLEVLRASVFESKAGTEPTLGAAVSYVEFMGRGAAQSQAIDQIEDLAARQMAGALHNPDARHHLGLQPHAPYSAGLGLYERCGQAGAVPVCTHLAETTEEIEFTKFATGPFADLIRSIGKWDESIRPSGRHPIDLLAPIFWRWPRWLAAHVNYACDEHISILARTNTSVAYCPRASAYFGHSGHRYREMLAAGVNVAIGTDSIICLDTSERISILDEMRLLYQRDGTDPLTLLRMATVNGAQALMFDPTLATFDHGPMAGLIGIPFDTRSDVAPLHQVLGQSDLPEIVNLHGVLQIGSGPR